jgi:GNAT superfamily N-acetyltransferase
MHIGGSLSEKTDEEKMKTNPEMDSQPTFTCKPLTIANWIDFEKLMGKQGGYGGCWCMFFRESRKEWRANIGDGNRLRFKEIVDCQKPVGLLAYDGDAPVGWCAVAPRVDYAALARSKNYKALDNKNCWSITCFYTAKESRRAGVSRFLIERVVNYACEHGAEVVEAYPVLTEKDRIRDDEGYRGFFKVFSDLGFTMAANISDKSPLMRNIISHQR